MPQFKVTFSHTVSASNAYAASQKVFAKYFDASEWRSNQPMFEVGPVDGPSTVLVDLQHEYVWPIYDARWDEPGAEEPTIEGS